jgi:polyisoprenoid-binding protein YceI
MKRLILVLLTVLTYTTTMAQLFSTSSGNVSFYSHTPVEDIRAENLSALAVLNTKGEVAFVINNTSFEFPNKLMQEHFNEKYMESDKFPISTFKGKVVEPINFAKDGEYQVTTTGKLLIHGVETDRTINGQIIVKDGKIYIKSNFMVKVADHNITIPKLVFAKIAEEIEVSIIAELLPKK